MHACPKTFLTLIATFNVTAFCLNSKQYTAAVVEFHPDSKLDLNPFDRLKRNVDECLRIFKEVAENQKLDIVVFPESALTHHGKIRKHDDYLPFSEQIPKKSSFCDDYRTSFIAPLACFAKEIKTYLVLNVYEREPCEGVYCEHAWKVFSTNLVLNRQGKIVSKYRVLISDRPKTDVVTVFKTDFGVTFGTFIGSEILLQKPALDLITKHNVTSIIFPNVWYSQLPFLTSLQVQQQWAYVTGATVLSSGVNDPVRASGGSGIYRGKNGPLVFGIINQGESKAFVTKVQDSRYLLEEETVEEIDKKAKLMDTFYLRQESINYFSEIVVERGQHFVNRTVCDIHFCCRIEMWLDWKDRDSRTNSYVYFIVAYEGPRNYFSRTYGFVEVCGVVACTQSSLDSCGKRFSDYDNVTWPLTFKRIKIESEFAITPRKIQYPNSLLSNIKPLPVSAIKWEEKKRNKEVTRTYTLIKPQNRLLTFAIFGQKFRRQDDMGHSSKSNIIVSSLTSTIYIQISNLLVMLYFLCGGLF